MTRLRIRTPSRLHFGLLGWGPHATRQFGGVGLMIEDPGVEVWFEPGPDWSFSGPLAGRVRDVARRLIDGSADPSFAGTWTPVHVTVVSSPTEHTGLGVGTQLSLAVTQGLAELSGLSALSTGQLAALSGRGRRSGIGLHGFQHGGLIVDGGRRDGSQPPPLVVRSPFPEEWSILLVRPPGPRGRSGDEEVQCFADLPPLSDRVTDRLCRLVLLGLLPALAERDLREFGAALSEVQYHIGAAFAPLQGGRYSSPMSQELVDLLAEWGLVGAGQSSWGPTLYAFGALAEPDRNLLRSRIQERFRLDESDILWTRAANHGARVERPVPA